MTNGEEREFCWTVPAEVSTELQLSKFVDACYSKLLNSLEEEGVVDYMIVDRRFRTTAGAKTYSVMVRCYDFDFSSLSVVTDVYTKAETDAEIDSKVVTDVYLKSETYTKSEVDAEIDSKVVVGAYVPNDTAWISDANTPITTQSFGITYDGENVPESYCTYLHVKGVGDDRAFQLASSYGSGTRLYFRSMYDTSDDWKTWEQVVLHSELTSKLGDYVSKTSTATQAVQSEFIVNRDSVGSIKFGKNYSNTSFANEIYNKSGTRTYYEIFYNEDHATVPNSTRLNSVLGDLYLRADAGKIKLLSDTEIDGDTTVGGDLSVEKIIKSDTLINLVPHGNDNLRFSFGTNSSTSQAMYLFDDTAGDYASLILGRSSYQAGAIRFNADDSIDVNGVVTVSGSTTSGNARIETWRGNSSYAVFGHYTVLANGSTSDARYPFMSMSNGSAYMASFDNTDNTRHAFDGGRSSNKISHIMNYSSTYQHDFTGTARFQDSLAVGGVTELGTNSSNTVPLNLHGGGYACSQYFYDSYGNKLGELGFPSRYSGGELRLECNNGGDINLNGKASVSGDFLMSSNASIRGDLDVSGGTSISGTLSADGINSKSTLSVDGKTTFYDEVRFFGSSKIVPIGTNYTTNYWTNYNTSSKTVYTAQLYPDNTVHLNLYFSATQSSSAPGIYIAGNVFNLTANRVHEFFMCKNSTGIVAAYLYYKSSTNGTYIQSRLAGIGTYNVSAVIAL